jgi:leucyl-tRNA synthetase
MSYDPHKIEPKWQEFWKSHRTFETTELTDKPKYYVLDMFPYPSGTGLHVGHPKGYTATDVIARKRRMEGFNVLHPIGWDAFGLPAEQHAVVTGVHPARETYKNIDTFRRQIQRLGFSYDWSRELATCDPYYYKWTQWIFLELYGRGLAYEAEVPVNWCPALGTVLANEEVVDGKSERGGHPVVRRPMKQWMLRITEYAERLLAGLDELDWPEGIKTMQREWIGRSEGAEIEFPVPSAGRSLRVFTTRPDTLFGATYMVLSPEHPWVDDLTDEEHRAEVEAYRDEAAKKSELDRTALTREKTGVFTGSRAVNPATGAEIPIWVADYVIMTYGTGVIMAVPGHDQRDYEFAREFGLPVVEVVSGGDLNRAAYEGEGLSVNSGFLDGLPTAEAKPRMIEWLEENGSGRATVSYKLRDWLFSRQRYWGEPFPVIKLEDGTAKPLPPEDLPVELPPLSDFKPTGTGESPLAKAEDWVRTVDPETGKPARRETHTMPQWAGSCWYYLRFVDPKNDEELWDPAKERYWMPVDLYVGGAEHAVLHLLYARFWHKVLYDAGLVSTSEPFPKLRNQGMVLGEDRTKMSKSRGNVVNPDEVIDEHGADTMRIYELFLGPLEKGGTWSTEGIEGVHRFLNRVWRLYFDSHGRIRSSIQEREPAEEELRILHRTIEKVSADIEEYGFNTAVAQLMMFVNELTGRPSLARSVMETFVLLLSPFAPHLGEEIWRALGHDDTLAYEAWPVAEKRYLALEKITVVVQINGKVRDRLEVPSDISEEEIKARVLERPKVQRHLDGRSPRKVIYVPGKLVSLVV